MLKCFCNHHFTSYNASAKQPHFEILVNENRILPIVGNYPGKWNRLVCSSHSITAGDAELKTKLDVRIPPDLSQSTVLGILPLYTTGIPLLARKKHVSGI
uniref:THAP-type domain-containing protein n=1 Tax=Echinococcus granulosus TaxID=6210 RepID=U6FU25_ECHGR|nr:hypothetical protein EgrG_000216900 [Echinococcus granulosus]